MQGDSAVISENSGVSKEGGRVSSSAYGRQAEFSLLLSRVHVVTQTASPL